MNGHGTTESRMLIGGRRAHRSNGASARIYALVNENIASVTRKGACDIAERNVLAARRRPQLAAGVVRVEDASGNR